MEKRKQNTVDATSLRIVARISDDLALVAGELGTLEVCFTINGLVRLDSDVLPTDLEAALDKLGWNHVKLGQRWSYSDGSGLSYAPIVAMAPQRRTME
jgi:hypothetical protein